MYRFLIFVVFLTFITISRVVTNKLSRQGKLRSQNQDEACLKDDNSVYPLENTTQGSMLKELCQTLRRHTSKKHAGEKSENGACLKKILSSIRFLTSQGLSFQAKNRHQSDRNLVAYKPIKNEHRSVKNLGDTPNPLKRG